MDCSTPEMMTLEDDVAFKAARDAASSHMKSGQL